MTCATPFEFNAGSGTCVISYCTKYGWSGCSQCEKGWLLNNGVCLRGDPYCISYSQQGACQACQNGFFLSGTQCTKNIPHCALFSQDNLSCLECRTGYSLYQFFCKKVIPNCQKMNYKD